MVGPRPDLVPSRMRAVATTPVDSSSLVGRGHLAPPTVGHVEDPAHLDDLVALARTGDSDAFGSLFRACGPQVLRSLVRVTRSEALAEDLTSEAFLRAFRKIHEFRGGGSAFRAWVTVIGRNLALDHFGSKRHRLERIADDRL